MQRAAGSASAFSRPLPVPPLALARSDAFPPSVITDALHNDPIAVLNSMRRYYLQLLSSPEVLPRPRVSASSGSARRTPKKRKARAMTSSERGLKFRRKQQERQEELVSATDSLRQEIARLEALKNMRRAGKLSMTFTEGGAPLRFALEYFAQFRFGVASEGSVSAAMAATTAEQQMDFLRAMVSHGALFNGLPAIQFVIESFSQKKKLSSFRLERESSELQVVDNSAIVVTKGVSHMRYSRHTIEQMFPHVLSNEELVRKLVGRQLHMPFKITMFFNEHGRLVRGEFERDPVTGLYEVLRSMEDCAAVLGDKAVEQSLARQKSRGPRLERREELTANAGRFQELVEPSEPPVKVPVEQQSHQRSAPPAAPMDLKFILS